MAEQLSHRTSGVDRTADVGSYLTWFRKHRDERNGHSILSADGELYSLPLMSVPPPEVEPAPVLVPAVPLLPEVLEPASPALPAPLVDCPGVAEVPLLVPWLPEVVLLVEPVPFCPPMVPVPEAEPLEPLPAPAPDCAIIHALASTRIAKTWSKRFIVIISLRA